MRTHLPFVLILTAAAPTGGWPLQGRITWGRTGMAGGDATVSASRVAIKASASTL